MRLILLFFTILAAFVLELVVGGRLAFLGINPPLLILALNFWFWELNLSKRIFLGAAMGILFDSISIFPFGTYAVMFILLAFLTELSQIVFSNIQSLLTKTVGAALAVFLILNLVLPVAHFLGYLGGVQVFLDAPLIKKDIFLSSIFWSVIAPSFLFGSMALYRRFLK